MEHTIFGLIKKRGELAGQHKVAVQAVDTLKADVDAIDHTLSCVAMRATKVIAPDLELCLNLGDAHHQAAWFSVSPVTSTPSLNLIPSMTFGNWFLPLSRNHFFDAA